MIFRAHHLPENQLFDCYLAEQTGEPMEPPSAEHLADCAQCSARYADLRRFMNGLRSDADAELDEVFPTEMFRVQHNHILRRLEGVGDVYSARRDTSGVASSMAAEQARIDVR